jgi:hypothetical protein
MIEPYGEGSENNKVQGVQVWSLSDICGSIYIPICMRKTRQMDTPLRFCSIYNEVKNSIVLKQTYHCFHCQYELYGLRHWRGHSTRCYNARGPWQSHFPTYSTGLLPICSLHQHVRSKDLHQKILSTPMAVTFLATA